MMMIATVTKTETTIKTNKNRQQLVKRKEFHYFITRYFWNMLFIMGVSLRTIVG